LGLSVLQEINQRFAAQGISLSLVENRAVEAAAPLVRVGQPGLQHDLQHGAVRGSIDPGEYCQLLLIELN
jgi:hypothetical protein